MNKKLIVGASLGNCVHVAGVIHFLQLAKQEGYETVFLGPAITPEVIIKKSKRIKCRYGKCRVSLDT